MEYCMTCGAELHQNNKTGQCTSCLGAKDCFDLMFLDGADTDD